MCDSAPEQMVELLMRDSEERLEAVGDHGVLAVLPLHSLALPVSGDGADGLGHSLACPGEQRHVHIHAVDSLVGDGNWVFSALVSVDLSGDLTRLERTVIPGDVLTVLIASPDLLPGSVEDPLGVTLLLGHGLAHRHHLDLRQRLLDSGLALHGVEVVQLEAVVSSGDGALVILALRVALDDTVVDWDILADILRPLLALSLELVVTKLHSGLVEGEVVIPRDVHTVLAVVVVLVGLDDGEREEGENDPHGWPVVCF